MQYTTRPRGRGFTLIELLVVIAIIAILAAILFPVFAKARTRAQQTACLNNMNQIGKAMMMYADDNEERVMYRWWEWTTSITPYVKSGDVFACPASTAPKPIMKAFPATKAETDVQDTIAAGTYPTNVPGYGIPRVYGHYAKNEEFLSNYGDTSSTYIGQVRPLTSWKDPASIVLVGESRGYKDDLDLKGNYEAQHYNDNNAPYIEPGGTTWTQVWNQLTNRHNGGQNDVYTDGHAAWHRWDWFQTQAGKHAICPAKENLSADAGW